MSLPLRLALALVAAFFIGSAAMIFDKYRDAEWEVSPAQIEAAKAQGKMGYESRPGTVAMLPIRSEIADMLIFQWVFMGLIGGVLVFYGTRPKKEA